jgi:drug/metabolite transporter (DMT)-like permease
MVESVNQSSSTSSGSASAGLSSSAGLSVRVLVAFACVYLFWGSTYVAIRFGVEVMSPFVLASVRFLISGPLMLAFCAARGLKIRQASWRDLAVLAAIGILMLGLGNMALVWCEQYLPSGLAALLIAVVPLYVALFEAVLPNGEGLRRRGWVGIAVGFGGLVILVSPGLRESLHGDTTQLLGAGVAMFSAFAWTCGSILARRAKIPASAFVAAGWEMLFAGVFNLGLLTLSGAGRDSRFTMQGFWSIAWLVVFGSLVGYTAYIYLLEHVPVAKVATYAYVNPIVAVILGALLLGERLVPIEYAGMAAILVAVYLVTSSKVKSGASIPEVETAAVEAQG